MSDGFKLKHLWVIDPVKRTAEPKLEQVVDLFSLLDLLIEWRVNLDVADPIQLLFEESLALLNL